MANLSVFVIIAVTCFSTASCQTYTDAQARSLLSAAGISVNKPQPATSLQNVRKATITGIITFKTASKCEVVITGGTESGHAPGPMSHSKGYKVDIRLNTCVNSYIKKSFPFDHTRGDGAPVYKSKAGNLYALESNHWDITYV